MVKIAFNSALAQKALGKEVPVSEKVRFFFLLLQTLALSFLGNFIFLGFIVDTDIL